MLDFLILNTVYLLGIITLGIILMGVFLEREELKWVTTIFSIIVALFLWNHKTEVIPFFTNNVLECILFSVSYIVIGIIWSFIKWKAYLNVVFNKVKKCKEEFIFEYSQIDDKNKPLFNDRLRDLGLKQYNENSYYSKIKSDTTLEEYLNMVTPVSSKNKTLIISWITYWPVSMLSTLLNDPFRRFFNWLYEQLSSSYNKMANKGKQRLLD